MSSYPIPSWGASQVSRLGHGLVASASRLPGISFKDSCSISYCTTTVAVVLWLRLPDLAVNVAVYVPAGVPWVFVDDDPPPPQAARPNNSTAVIGIARIGIRRR